MKSKKLPFIALTAISPVDGRYNSTTAKLAPYYSEYGLIYYRLCMEIKSLLMLDDLNIKSPGTICMPLFSETQRKYLFDQLNSENFSIEIAEQIKLVEKKADHDVDSVVRVLKAALQEKGFAPEHVAHVHFGLTSEDVNNLSYAPMQIESTHDVFIEILEDLYNTLWSMAHEHADTIMIARTHGQPATPTSFGKEMRIFVERLRDEVDNLRNYKAKVKINGASGNYNGLVLAYPEVNWPQFGYDFIKKYYNNGKESGPYEINLHTTQIESHDTFSVLFGIYQRINVILKKLTKDMWLYISYGILKQKSKKGETGSSAMPHKVNPINFENAEGNLGVANALFAHFCEKLPDARMQRDLSDSTVIRYIGSAFASSLIAYENIMKGLAKVEVDKVKIQSELESHPEIIAEAIQLILRKHGYVDGYDKLKDFTRGNAITMDSLHDFIKSLNLGEQLENQLLSITPANYCGLVKELATISSADALVDKYAHLK